MRIRSLLPLFVVALLVGGALVIFPLKSTARDTVPWPALGSYFSQDFRNAGFSITCVSGTQETCTVNWTNPADRTSQRVPVYSFADEQDLTRGEILRRFHEKASKAAGSGDVVRALGVLDGFFQSGLRRMADRAMRRAREGSAEVFRLPPFRLSDARRVSGRDVRQVEGIDASFSTIPTGLPRRPSYQADVIASSEFSGASGGAMAIRLVRPVGSTVVQILDPASTRTCREISPDGSPDELPCRAVTITACRASKHYDCRNPALEIHALAPGLAIARSAGNGDAKLLSRGGQPLALDEVLVARAEKGKRFDPLQVEATRTPMQSFRIELIHGGDVPVSRQRMVNGRWERWFEPSVQPWLEPLVTRWEQLADAAPTAQTAKLDRKKPVRLSVDLPLQLALEEKLSSWMDGGGWERQVRRHLTASHYTQTRTRRLNHRSGESGHRRPVPHAGVTVLDAQTGNIIAVASYPPARALLMKDGQPSFAPGWRERLVGNNAPAWASRDILEVLSDRIINDTNANFVTHPVGSTFKPLLLSLTIDSTPRGGVADGLDPLFNLMVAGHLPPPAMPVPAPYVCPACARSDHEAVAGLPLGPYGNEEGSWIHKLDSWIDRSEFLVASCNKYAVTLGVLTMFDWTQPSGNTSSCCWNVQRDTFALSPNQLASGGSPLPYQPDVYSDPSRLPPLGPWLNAATASTTARFADAPIFARLDRYYGVPGRTHPDAYDPLPWAKCVGFDPIADRANVPRMGSIARTQLSLTGQIVGPSFTNIFTGAGHNWWSSVKLAEAYARMATNKEVTAGLCGGSSAQGGLFADASRHAELLQILSRQREASWVHLNAVNEWIKGGPDRVALSKTGTTLRGAGYSSTGVFALFVGTATEMIGPHPTRVGKGIVMVVYVDDIGKSDDVTRLTDHLFTALQARIDR
jgi:hypothetical protein